MSFLRSTWWWGVAIAAVALGLRVYKLSARPMHADEAVQGVKFIDLLEGRGYRYDPREFHGPTLAYLTLAAARLAGQTDGAALNETTLRLVPAVVGILLALSPLLLADGLGRRAAIFGAASIAISPALVFFSRYYIHEMLLVCFTAYGVGFIWRFYQSGRWAWAAAAGAALGLMAATKETFVLSIAAMAVADLAVAAVCKPKRLLPNCRAALLSLAVTAIVVWAALMTSFGYNPTGILDAFKAFWYWFSVGSTHSVHFHPWWWYLDLLIWNELTEKPVWNEDILVVGAAVAVWFLFKSRAALARRRPLILFLMAYALVLMAIYSAIPYKTPWCALNFLYPMVVLAAFAADRMLHEWQQVGGGRAMAILLAVFGVVNPLAQAVFLNYRFHSHASNPWAYAATDPQALQMVTAVNRAVAASEFGNTAPIQVIAAENDYWPLPWYFRHLTQVGYLDKPDSRYPKPQIVLAQQALQDQLAEALYGQDGGQTLYAPLFDKPLRLRTGVYWVGFVAYPLWEKMNAVEMDTHGGQTVTDILIGDIMDDPTIQKFSREAMNTVFEIWIQTENSALARQTANEAFAQAEKLEQMFSRFIDHSDISRINRAAAGQEIVVSPETLAVLSIAEQARQETDGAFDIAFRSTAEWTKQGRIPPPAFELLPDAVSVRVLRSAPQLDLGGIGKGFALDQMAEIVKEAGLSRALLHCGASTVLALEPPTGKSGWPVRFADPRQPEKTQTVWLARQVLSCSGLQRGEHIFDPKSGKAASAFRAIWLVCGGNAARADALSTGLMTMSYEQVRDSMVRGKDFGAALVPNDITKPILYVGSWPEKQIKVGGGEIKIKMEL